MEVVTLLVVIKNQCIATNLEKIAFCLKNVVSGMPG